EQALEVGRKLADTLRQNPLQWKGQRIAITLSIGVAEWSAEHGNSFEALMTQADAALYRVKDGGRDGIAASQARPRLSLAKS
ncbi:MAG: diguanylate cyclase, partial [Devosia nanyangense]|nr:diguanylate cyclase [Devosia nanyangense]